MESLLSQLQPNKVKKDLEFALEQMNTLPNRFRSYDIYVEKKNYIQQIKRVNKLIQEINTEAIKERHWKQISKVIKVHKKQHEIYFQDLVNANILNFEDKIN